MANSELIKMTDRNAGCTNQPARCWFVPVGFSIQPGSRFDPRALGWTEDINCITYDISDDTCQEPEACSSPSMAASTTLSRRVDDTGTLVVNYGSSSDTLVYRLLRNSDNELVWTAQTPGGAKSFVVAYNFPTTGNYTLTAEKLGQSSCASSELVSVVGNTPIPSGNWQKDGDDTLV